jgi:integrase
MVKAMESHWRLRLLKRFGGANAATLTTADVQRFVDELVGTDLAPRTIHNNVMSLRVVFKWANQRGMMYRNPCDGLALPSGEVARDTIVAWPVAEQMLQTLLRADTPAWEVAMWATACLAGLRRGELLALTWSEVDLKAKKLGVRLSYSPATGQQTAPKTAKGIRTVPIVDQLAPYLELARIGRDDDGLVFSRTGTSRPNPGAAIWRAAKLWKAAGLQPLGFHEARHTFASLMLAAGVDLYVVSKLLGHASIQITVDRYGHLVEGAADQARAQFSAYLAAQTAAA